MARRFTEEEAQRVFARAAERQHARAAPPDGLTLAELQEIGRQAGLDPAHVVAAVAEGDVETEGRETWHGVPVGVHRTRLLPARISDAEWERVVDLLRAEFKTPGAAQQIGRRREWVSAGGSLATTVTVQERPDGDLVTVRTPNNARQFANVSLISTAGTGALLAVLLAATDGLTPRTLAIPVMAAVFGAVLYAAAFLAVKVKASRAPAQTDRLLDRIDLLSRDRRRLGGAGRPPRPRREHRSGAARPRRTPRYARGRGGRPSSGPGLAAR